MKKIALMALLCTMSTFPMDSDSDSSSDSEIAFYTSPQFFRYQDSEDSSSSSDSDTEHYKLLTKFPSKKSISQYQLLEAANPFLPHQPVQIIRYQKYVVFYDSHGQRVYIPFNKLPKGLSKNIVAKIKQAEKNKSFFKTLTIKEVDVIVNAIITNKKK